MNYILFLIILGLFASISQNVVYWQENKNLHAFVLEEWRETQLSRAKEKWLQGRDEYLIELHREICFHSKNQRRGA